jgi:hypothetical protein
MPRVAPAKPLPRYLQGATKDIADITLRDGRQLAVAIGSAVTTPPLSTRTLDGSSSLEISMYGPAQRLLELTLLAEKFDLELDGLKFRHLASQKTGRDVRLTFGPGGAEVADAATEIKNFLTGSGDYGQGGAIGYYCSHPQATFYEIAHALQNSADWASGGDGSKNYAAVGDEGRAWAEAVWARPPMRPNLGPNPSKSPTPSPSARKRPTGGRSSAWRRKSTGGRSLSPAASTLSLSRN